MSTNIPFVQDDEATAEVRELFGRIKAKRGFVAPSWRALANKPEYLKLVIEKFELVFGESKLDARSKMLIYLTVSILNNCPPCMYAFYGRLREMGVSDEEFVELHSVIDAASGMNIFVNSCGFAVEELQEVIKNSKE